MRTPVNVNEQSSVLDKQESRLSISGVPQRIFFEMRDGKQRYPRMLSLDPLRQILRHMGEMGLGPSKAIAVIERAVEARSGTNASGGHGVLCKFGKTVVLNWELLDRPSGIIAVSEEGLETTGFWRRGGRVWKGCQLSIKKKKRNEPLDMRTCPAFCSANPWATPSADQVMSGVGMPLIMATRAVERVSVTWWARSEQVYAKTTGSKGSSGTALAMERTKVASCARDQQATRVKEERALTSWSSSRPTAVCWYAHGRGTLSSPKRVT